MKMYYSRWFTIVELIVVITIVSILSTIGFVAYVDYLKGVRDSSRLQQISEIHGSMELYATRSALPLPDDNISIVAGATQVGYQWVAGNSVLDAIRFSNGGKDPSTKKYFTYYLSADRKYAQLLAFFEEQQAGNLLSYTTIQAQYDTLYPQVYGSELGLLLDQNTSTPVHEISQYTSSGKLDILNISKPVVSYLSNTEQITGTWQALIGMIPNTSCKKIRDVYGYTTTWIYKINPSGIKMKDIYCDMVFDWGGWTLVARSVSWATWNFWWLIERWSVFDDTDTYSLGNDIQNIAFSEMLLTHYDNEKDIGGWWYFTNLDRTIIANANNAFSTATCTLYPWTPSLTEICYNKWWVVPSFWQYNFNWGSAPDPLTNSIGLKAGGFFSNRWWNTINGKQAMIFIR